MNRVKGHTSIAAAISAGLLAAACVSAPEQAALSGRVVEPAPNAAATRSPGAAGGGTPVEPSLVVDARDPAPGSAVTCRDLLKQGSNVIVTRCMTRDDWKMFERRRALEAAEIVRTLQGGAYR